LATANAIHLDRDETRLNLKYGSTGLIASMKAIAAAALTAALPNAALALGFRSSFSVDAQNRTATTACSGIKM
jgi:hypothetical protein